MARSQHTPLFPNYPYVYTPERNVYFLDGRRIYDENGVAYSVPEFNDVREFLFKHNALVFVKSLQNDAKLLNSIVHDEQSVVSATKAGIPTSSTIQSPLDKRKRRKIVSSKAWGSNIDLCPRFLRDVKEVYKACNVGVYPTPSTLGKAMMFDSWQAWNLPLHTAPNIRAVTFLQQHAFGGRCDTPGAGNFYDTAIEYDMSSAYLAHSYPLPTGTSIPFLATDINQFATFFAHCKITIHYELPLGPFPKRLAGSKRIVYPTLPGTYETYLWKEQIEDCRAAGCTVELLDGYGWKNVTEDMLYYAKEAYDLRMHYFGEDIEGYMKQIIVASFGQFGSFGNYYCLVPHERAMPQDRWVVDEHGPLDVYIHELPPNYNVPAMAHWYFFILMQCARTLYHFALPFAKQGRLIMSNYDAVVVTEGNEHHTYVRKYTYAAKEVHAGSWRWSRLLNFDCKADRSYSCTLEYPDGTHKNKLVTPGVPHETTVTQ